MSQITVTLDAKLDRVVSVIKGLYGLPSKDKAIQFIIGEKAEEMFERELRPEFVKKMLKLEKNGKFTRYSSMKELWDEIEHA